MKDVILDVIPNPVIVYDLYWRIRNINGAALDLLGYSKVDELYGKPIQQILVGDFDSLGDSCEIEHTTKNGERVKMFAQFKKVADLKEKESYYYIQSAFYQDKEKTQGPSKEELAVYNEVKSEFVAKISHEMRTPLNAIIGFVDQLMRTRLTKTQFTYSEIICNSSLHLLSIVKDIHVLSNVENDQNHLEPEPFKIGIVLKSVLDILDHRIKKKHLALRVRCEVPSELNLLGNPSKLRQILINLVSNSIKFTSQGEIVLSCSTILDTANHCAIRFEVSDSGIGIPQDKLTYIFEPFCQVDSSLGRKYFGSGLGLTICKELVTSLGGEIRVASTLGKGSTFSFDLTFEKSTKHSLAHQQLKSEVQKDLLNTGNILFVDDDPINRLLGKVILTKYKAKVVFAKTGEEAIRRYRPGRFQVVLLDINLPDLNGMEVAKRLREIESHANKMIPAVIVAMTANALQSQIKKFIKAGMDDFMLKPFSEEILHQKIALHSSLRKEEKTRGVADVNSDADEMAFSLEKLLEFTKGDRDFAYLMLTTFVNSSLSVLGEIEKDYERNDYPSIAESVHRLLPSFQQLGFLTTHKTLKDIERRYFKKEVYVMDPALIENALREIRLCVEMAESVIHKTK